jgi:acyl-CoA synthetase (AMP-forming)/AMP-acid ligase II
MADRDCAGRNGFETAGAAAQAGVRGRAVLNVETRVVDELGRNVPVGAVGEVVHRSPQLLSGYYHDVERTDAAFSGGWFHSGDLARIDHDGYLTIVDRKKDMIKTGGENVASREVEKCSTASTASPRWQSSDCRTLCGSSR